MMCSSNRLTGQCKVTAKCDWPIPTTAVNFNRFIDRYHDAFCTQQTDKLRATLKKVIIEDVEQRSNEEIFFPFLK